MPPQIDVLMEKLRAVEAEIEVELTKRREALRYRIENSKIVFADDVLAVQRAIKVNLARYIRNANPLVVLTAPVIYSLIIPFVVLDLFVMAYQAICFPVYKISKVRRRDYLVFDRHHLAYLNILEKINCAYCSYGNGVLAFAREVAARTEVYWCPIKHARRVLGPHPYYQGFADFGDAEAFRAKIDGMKIDGGKPNLP
ncbi:hypothetical protein [Rhodopseudomonas sp. P2A-2r]|uniref:hypothetical protein n=1 Tax=unclassified Rhodopseudomonas TaxID=2638247 RepID=UPI002233FFED|nr:hypothetical protein [Rhodopseudomonas sp. P2A-2r]UZE48962.1 hypothetical protein ONR75_30235 [Rhodopseudomonas sp. P2A-2r]